MSSSYIEKILRDYQYAVMNIVWTYQVISGEVLRKLIFMSIEFYPNECEEFFETPERSIRIKKTHIRLFYRRIKITSKQALDIYIKCDKDNMIKMEWDEQFATVEGSEKIIKLASYNSIPKWPSFSVSKKSEEYLCPFIPSNWGVCRLHHRIPVEYDPFLNELCKFENIAQWLNDCLKWNISDYAELIGSIHIILPNPIYRSLEWKLIPAKGDNALEEIHGHIFLRENRDMDTDVELLSIERSDVGYLNATRTMVQSSDIIIKTSGCVEEYAYLVYSKQYGLLDYGGFSYFLRSVHLSISLQEKIRVVEIKESNSVTKYKVPLNDCVSSSVIGSNDSQAIDLGKKLAYSRTRYNNRKYAQKLGQHIFRRNDTKKADEYIRNIFGKAKKRVIVVDPYFSTIELYKFILNVSSSDVDIDIITSNNILKEKIHDSCKGMQLYYELKKLEHNHIENMINIFVMNGKSPAIHDRFLIIDDNVYFSGNSLNHIGERASMMLRVPDPDEVLNLVDEIKNNEQECITLDEWVIHRSEISQDEEKK